ncbi:MAG: hypothetical protein RJA61_602 [Candidatus Parcubacteria bacterium]|jgi:hypothetical protein
MNPELGIKKKRYWLRGGVVLAVFTLISIIFGFDNIARIIFGVISAVASDVFFGCSTVDFFALACPSGIETSSIFYGEILGFVLSLAFFFLVGSILGLVYGVFKNRKSSQLKPKS